MAPRFIDHVGLQIHEHAQGASRLTLSVQALHINTHGVVHGGAIFTLADTGMGCALMSVLGPGETCTTIEIKINYFRPVREGLLECRSQVVHQGRTIANIESLVTQGDKLIAKANGSFAILASRVPSA